MPKILKTLFFMFALICFSPMAQAQQVPLNIAIVDFEKINRNAAAMRSIREQVQQRRESYRNEVQQEENSLRQANQELLQKQTLLTPEAFQAERQKFEQSIQNVQRKIQEKNQGLQRAQNEARKKIQDELRKIILEISQQRGYTLVLRHAQTVIVADPYNITDVVIAELNKRLPTLKVF